MVKFYYPANIPNINFHHWAAGIALATSIAHKGAVAGSKVMAASIVECFKNPAVIDEAKRMFKDEIGARPRVQMMLPPDQKPPVELNREMMEKFRPLLEKHYVKEKPNFV